jgi:hypothetical protein
MAMVAAAVPMLVRAVTVDHLFPATAAYYQEDVVFRESLNPKLALAEYAQ